MMRVTCGLVVAALALQLAMVLYPTAWTVLACMFVGQSAFGIAILIYAVRVWRERQSNGEEAPRRALASTTASEGHPEHRR